MAVLFLFATAVQAQVVDFHIDTNQSWLSRTGSGFQPTDGAGNPTSPLLLVTPQNAGLINPGIVPPGSITAALNGELYAAVVPGVAIQFFSGALLGQPTQSPNTGPLNMQVQTTGNYLPGRDGAGNLPQSGPPPQPGNFGSRLPAAAALSRDSDWAFDAPLSLNATFTAPAPVLTDGAGNFNAHGVVLFQNKGIEDIVSGIASPSKNNLASTTPIPVDYNNGPTGVGGFDAGGLPGGMINPLTFHLVLPVNLVIYSSVKVNGNLIGFLVSAINGQIVADPAVPEPSTITLFGFGVVGLLSYAWRTRKRKLLVA